MAKAGLNCSMPTSLVSATNKAAIQALRQKEQGKGLSRLTFTLNQ